MNLFISYGHDEHKQLIERIAHDLEQLGHNVWVDYKELHATLELSEEIEKGINQCNYFLLLMSPYSMRRPDGYCLKELAWASYHNKPIFPIKVHEVEPILEIIRTLWLDMMQYRNALGGIDEDYYQEKLEEINSIIKGVKEMPYPLDSHHGLIPFLKPLNNESYLTNIDYSFYGREWLFQYYNEWLEINKTSRIFCIVGQPGCGKTAFVTKLSQVSKNVSGIHFCKHNNEERANPKRVIMSLAYHLSSQLPAYKEMLFSLIDLPYLINKGVNRLFEYLFIEPFALIEHPENDIILIIDALDEANKETKNELVELIVSDFHKTPTWLRLVVTTRPEQDIFLKIKHLKPVIIESNSESNLQDIKGFFETNINNLEKYLNHEEIVHKLLENSEGNFLYASEIVKSIKSGELDLKNIDDFPKSLIPIYNRYFERLFKLENTYDYSKSIRPILEIITASFEPLKITEIKEILKIDEYFFEEILSHIFVLFPNNGLTIEPIHKSLIDWLLDKEHSGKYFILIKNAHERLAYFYYQKYLNQNFDEYTIKYTTKHTLLSKEPRNALDLLIDSNLQEQRRALIGQDSTIRTYINEISDLYKIDSYTVLKVIQSKTFQDILIRNKEFIYHNAMYFKLKDIGFDNVIEEYIKSNQLELLTCCMRYYYIVDNCNKTFELGKYVINNFDESINTCFLIEIHRFMGNNYWKKCDYDNAIKHYEIAANLGHKTGNKYIISIKFEMIGKIKSIRQEFDEANNMISSAIQIIIELINETFEYDDKRMLSLFLSSLERVQALNLLWQNNYDQANIHLVNAQNIYNASISHDRYYVRYLYMLMFKEFLCSNLDEAKLFYQQSTNEAISKYDTSQIEFYYTLGLYIHSFSEEEVIEHINQAMVAIKSCAAVQEENCIILLNNMIKSNGALVTSNLIDYETNSDIHNWINYVYKFINDNKQRIMQS